MRWWIAIAIFALIGVGFYCKVLSVDPLSMVILAVLFIGNSASVKRDQQLADLIKKSHGVLAANHKELATKLERIRTDLKYRK